MFLYNANALSLRCFRPMPILFGNFLGSCRKKHYFCFMKQVWNINVQLRPHCGRNDTTTIKEQILLMVSAGS